MAPFSHDHLALFFFFLSKYLAIGSASGPVLSVGCWNPCRPTFVGRSLTIDLFRSGGFPFFQLGRAPNPCLWIFPVSCLGADFLLMSFRGPLSPFCSPPGMLRRALRFSGSLSAFLSVAFIFPLFLRSRGGLGNSPKLPRFPFPPPFPERGHGHMSPSFQFFSPHYGVFCLFLTAHL